MGRRAVVDLFDAAVPREAESTGLGDSRISGSGQRRRQICGPLSKPARSHLIGLGVTVSQRHGYDCHHRQFDDLSWTRSRIAWLPLRVVKLGPCRLRNFESGLSAPTSLRTRFYIFLGLSPTKAP